MRHLVKLYKNVVRVIEEKWVSYTKRCGVVGDIDVFTSDPVPEENRIALWDMQENIKYIFDYVNLGKFFQMNGNVKNPYTGKDFTANQIYYVLSKYAEHPDAPKHVYLAPGKKQYIFKELVTSPEQTLFFIEKRRKHILFVEDTKACIDLLYDEYKTCINNIFRKPNHYTLFDIVDTACAASHSTGSIIFSIIAIYQELHLFTDIRLMDSYNELESYLLTLKAKTYINITQYCIAVEIFKVQLHTCFSMYEGLLR